jgi:hypothetical protein
VSALNIYRYSFKAICPVDQATIVYRLQIETDAVIKAESIVGECMFGQPVFHEDIADRLLKSLGGKQTIIATHAGVEIETKRSAQ